MSTLTKIPKLPSHRPSEKVKAQYDHDMEHIFAPYVLELIREAGFTQTKRGLNYTFEQRGLISKDEFPQGGKAINYCRQKGFLPLDCIVEKGRNIYCKLYRHNPNPLEYVRLMLSYISDCHTRYNPIGVWDNQPYQPIVIVEKEDLLTLWRPQCDALQLPIVNAEGWSSHTLQGKVAEIFIKAEDAGKIPVILAANDHDPVGLNISNSYKRHYADWRVATKWNPDNLIVDRFALNADYIDANGLGWIEYTPPKNYKTKQSTDDTDSDAALYEPDQTFVDNYIAQYGYRKAEANALVARPAEARQLLTDTINKYLDPTLYDEYQEQLAEARGAVEQILSTINFNYN